MSEEKIIDENGNGENVIEVKNLTKMYGTHTAVSNLSFTIGKGQIYGLLGPNGAGKSTTMNIMTGCLAATSGEVKIGGYDIFEDAAKAKRLIGYLPEQPPLYQDRTPREYLTFVAEAKKIPAEEIDQQIDHVMKMTQISYMENRLIKYLSKGYKQRVGIAQAILGDPEVVILDEPTVGLDPRQIIEIRDLIRELGKTHTVILSSHILYEVQAVCQTVMIISKGRMVACDTPENLEKLFSGSTTVSIRAEASVEEAMKILSNISGIGEYSLEEKAGGCEIQISAGRDEGDLLCRKLFFAFAKAEKAIIRMNADKANLEDVFIELTKEDETDESYLQA